MKQDKESAAVRRPAPTCAVNVPDVPCARALCELMCDSDVRRARLLLDEVDLVLHPLKSELNFPIGIKVDLDYTREGERWKLPIALIDVVLFAARRAETASKATKAAGAADEVVAAERCTGCCSVP